MKKIEIVRSIPRTMSGELEKSALTERILAEMSSDFEHRLVPVNFGMAVIMKPIAKDNKKPSTMWCGWLCAG
jgi:hypothetical protein